MIATAPQVEATGRYTVAATATHLGISRRTVQRYIAAGTMKVQYRKVNNKPFVTGLEIVRIWNQTY
jgi:predicted site-specific integrase-resolvase